MCDSGFTIELFGENSVSYTDKMSGVIRLGNGHPEGIRFTLAHELTHANAINRGDVDCGVKFYAGGAWAGGFGCQPPGANDYAKRDVLAGLEGGNCIEIARHFEESVAQAVANVVVYGTSGCPSKDIVANEILNGNIPGYVHNHYAYFSELDFSGRLDENDPGSQCIFFVTNKIQFLYPFDTFLAQYDKVPCVCNIEREQLPGCTILNEYD